jgi:hypothetical protein
VLGVQFQSMVVPWWRFVFSDDSIVVGFRFGSVEFRSGRGRRDIVIPSQEEVGDAPKVVDCTIRRD